LTQDGIDKTFFYGFLGEQAGADHYGGVRGVGAGGDSGDDYAAVL